jgi:hypothetical protein
MTLCLWTEEPSATHLAALPEGLAHEAAGPIAEHELIALLGPPALGHADDDLGAPVHRALLDAARQAGLARGLRAEPRQHRARLLLHLRLLRARRKAAHARRLLLLLLLRGLIWP